MNSDIPVSGIILAAGLSTRMGSLNKLLYPFRGVPLLSHIIDSALASRLDRVIVVTGHESSDILDIVPPECLTIHNSDYAGGMSGSIRSGIYRLQGLSSIMILPGDMALINSTHIDNLLDSYSRCGSQNSIIVATCNGEWGHPVLFGSSYFGSLKLLDGDTGGRSLMLSHESCVVTEEIGSAAIQDFDDLASFGSA